MSHIANAIVFVACLAWIAASCVLPGHAGHELGSWNTLAVVGAGLSVLNIMVDD